MRRNAARLALTGLITVGVMALAPAAYAGKPSGGSGGKGGGSSASLSLVVLDGGNSTPNWGEHITFNVTQSATDKPYVSVTCSQGGTAVMTGSAGFYASYPWGQTFGLSSSSWTSGAADCTADLHYTSSNGHKVTLATLNFHVDA